MTERDHILAALAVSRQWMTVTQIADASEGQISRLTVYATLERLAFEYLVQSRYGGEDALEYQITDAGLRAVHEMRNPADAQMSKVRAIPTTVWGAMSFAAVLAWEAVQDWWNARRKR